MQLPHNAYVMVADGRKMLFFRNEGDSEYPNLVVEEQDFHPNPADRDQGSEEPGRTFSGQGMGARSAYSEADHHQMEEDRFAKEAAQLLNNGALAGRFDKLVVVAPARTLGELRRHYRPEVSQRLLGELAKDLTSHTVPEIEKLLSAAD